MASIPTAAAPDDTPALLRLGYRYVSQRCEELGSDVFETRLGRRRVMCITGRAGAQEFYEHPITRSGGLPPRALRLLQDSGSVATLDGPEHHRRKQPFLGIAGPGALDPLLDAAAGEWELAIARWERADHVVLLDVVEELLRRAACAWAGVPLGEPEAQERTRAFSAMIDGSGSVGLRNARGQVQRRHAERWARDVLATVGEGAGSAPPGDALTAIAGYEDGAGSPLDPAVEAVELINVIRPTVAVARYIVFVAHALHTWPGAPTDDTEAFVQEVRRAYPFFPLVASLARDPFELLGVHVPAGRPVVLDLYGTDHDVRCWDTPGEFRPQRFVGWRHDPYTLVPQGGGDHPSTHRCPGEWATIALMEQAFEVLTRKIGYQVTPQDLDIDLSRIPA